MNIYEVVPILAVIFFWALAFCFAFWFTTRALRAPVEHEHEEAPVDAHELQDSAATVDDQVPTGTAS